MKKQGFAAVDYTMGQMNDTVKIMMAQAGDDAVERFLSGKLILSEPPRSWREQDGVIYLTVTSDGTTGPELIKRLKDKGFHISDYAKSIVNSPDFKPTTDMITEIAILKGMLFSDSDRTTKKIRAEAGKRNFTAPNAEVACLIREKFTDKDIKAMGLYWIVTMHEPIKDSDGGSRLLDVHRGGDGRWLSASWARPGDGWSRDSGFAFVRSRKSSA